MTAFDPTQNPTNERLTASITVDDLDANLNRIQAKFVEVANCLNALDPTSPLGPVDPDTGDMTNIPLVFKTVTDEDDNTQIVQADISSTAAFQRSLSGLTINAGEAVIASNSNPNAFGTSVGRGDALFAKVNNPTQDISNITDWLRLEGDDSYSITLSERQFINTLNEDDVAVRVADAADSVTITFYLLNTAATVDGDLTGGQTGSFHQTTDQRSGILYVRVPQSYINAFGADRIYVEIINPGGTSSTFVALSTFTERTDLLVAGDDVFESLGFNHGTSINYEAGQTIKLWQTRLSREWYFNAAFDVLRGLQNNSIPIEKLQPAVQALIRDHPDIDLTSFESRLDALFPLARDVNVLDDWARIYDPARASATVVDSDQYTLMADFRTTSDHYESTGVTYDDTGTDIVDYSGLTDGTARSFGVVAVAAANQTLLSLGNGGSVIPFIDVTAGGAVRVNNFTPARTQDQVINNHYVAGVLSTGTGTIAVGGAASTYTIPTYPANTDEQSRSASVEFDVLVNGVDTSAGGFINIDLPNDDTAQAKRTVNHSFYLGFPTGRTVNVTVGYEFRKVGADFFLDLTLENAPADVTLSTQAVETFQTYTATVVIARVDNWISFGTGAGAFTFSGEHEFLFEIVPIPNDANGRLEVIGAAINTSSSVVTEFNNVRISAPSPSFDEVQIPDTIEFRTFKTNHYITHSGSASLLRDRADRFVYGLAREEVVTGHAITADVDLTAGSTINGNEFSRDIAATAIGGTGDSVLTLPADYTDFELLHATVVEDGGQTMHADISTRWLDRNATITTVRIAGNDFGTWNEAARTLTLHETADTFEEALLYVPRLS